MPWFHPFDDSFVIRSLYGAKENAITGGYYIPVVTLECF
jgi:hypothetical protein